MKFLYKNCWKIFCIVQIVFVVFFYVTTKSFYVSFGATLLFITPISLIITLPMRLMIKQIEREKYFK